jgi:hypothetical protein
MPRSFGIRNYRKNSKVRGLHLEAFKEGIKSWRLLEFQRFREIVGRLGAVEESSEKTFEKWYNWPIYGSDAAFHKEFHFHTTYKEDVRELISAPLSPHKPSPSLLMIPLTPPSQLEPHQSMEQLSPIRPHTSRIEQP